MNLFILRQAPYSSSLAREALDMALAFAAFDQEVALLFMGDAVYQLLELQNSQGQGVKNIAKTLDSLALFDINKTYVCQQSLKQRQLAEHANMKTFVQAIDSAEIQRLIASSHKVFNF